MAKPLLRYLPAKLKPLSAPAVWIPLTIFTLLSILLWEYYHNPDRFERDSITNANPESSLTPEEQAKLSEIDTVDLLLKGAQVSGPLSDIDSMDIDSLEKNKDLLELEALDSASDIDVEAGTAAGDRRLANRSDPFGTYAAEYEFSGTNRSTPKLNPSAISTNSNSPLESTAPSAPSAFSNAINQQQTIRASEAARNSESEAAPAATSLEGFSQSSPQPSQSISTPFIRTTPAMSPAVGTTGYQAPANTNLPSFNLAPTPTTPNPLNGSTTQNPNAIAPGRIGTVQPRPLARPIQPTQVPPSGTIYTAPSSTQPEQNRRAR